MNERVKQIREHFGLTLEKFGERVGVSKVAISRIENNKSNVSNQMFTSICREFNINEEWFRSGTGEMLISEDNMISEYLGEIAVSDDEFIKKFIETYMELTPESKQLIKDFAKKIAK